MVVKHHLSMLNIQLKSGTRLRGPGVELIPWLHDEEGGDGSGGEAPSDAGV